VTATINRLSGETAMQNPGDVLPILSQQYAFDARGVARRFRHAAIFGALDALEPGEVMRFVNDHDPLPLLAQIERHFGPRVDIGYVAREPGNIVIDFTVKAVD